jgi:hypothetical protein
MDEPTAPFSHAASVAIAVADVTPRSCAHAAAIPRDRTAR